MSIHLQLAAKHLPLPLVPPPVRFAPVGGYGQDHVCLTAAVATDQSPLDPFFDKEGAVPTVFVAIDLATVGVEVPPRGMEIDPFDMEVAPLGLGVAPPGVVILANVVG